jgi:hypothetical protein
VGCLRSLKIPSFGVYVPSFTTYPEELQAAVLLALTQPVAADGAFCSDNVAVLFTLLHKRYVLGGCGAVGLGAWFRRRCRLCRDSTKYWSISSHKGVVQDAPWDGGAVLFERWTVWKPTGGQHKHQKWLQVCEDILRLWRCCCCCACLQAGVCTCACQHGGGTG